MKINTFFVCGIVLAISACNPTKQTKEIQLVENGVKLKMIDSTALKPVEIREGATLGGKPLVIEALPKSYTSRKFFEGLAGLTYDIVYIPGNIVKFDSTDSSYKIVTLKPVLLDSLMPNIKTLDKAIIYSNKINNSASFNATALIGSANVGANQIMEVVIQDVTTSIVPNNHIDTVAINSLIKKIDKNKLKNYFFVKTATLTLVNTKKYTEASLNVKTNLSFVTADGKAYSSNDSFSQGRVVSLDLVSLEDVL